MSTGFSREDIAVLLDELNDELQRRDAHAGLFLVARCGHRGGL
jgi:hypothetical protein